MVITGKGRNIDIQLLTVSNTVDTQVGFSTQEVHNQVTIAERTTNGLQIRTSPSATNFYTLASGKTLTLDLLSNPAGIYNLYIRAASSTSTVELLGVLGG